MPTLTGEFDVAAEVGVPLLNRLLAAIHELQDRDYPRFLHSLTLPVYDLPRDDLPFPDPVPEPERTGVTGEAELQLSAPELSLPADGDGRRVTVVVELRAWLRNRAGPSVPEFVHGTLSLGAPVRLAAGPPLVVDVGLRASGLEVRFAPTAGTPIAAGEQRRIEQIARNALKLELLPVNMNLDLAAEIRHLRFKTVAGGSPPSMLLLFGLTAGTPSSDAEEAVAGGFLPSGADLAVAVSREYLEPLLRAEMLRGLPAEYSSWLGSFWPDWAGARLEFESDVLVLTVGGAARLAGVRVRLTIRQRFGLRAAAGGLEPVAVGGPEISFRGLPRFLRRIARSLVRGELERARDLAITQARAALAGPLDPRTQLADVLRRMHPAPPGLSITHAHIREDGVVIGGRCSLAPTREVVAIQRPTRRESGIANGSDAIESWVPGGTITRYRWYSAAGHVRDEHHRFVTELPPLPDPRASTWCLEVEGSRSTATGSRQTVRGYHCGHSFPDITFIPPGSAGDWYYPAVALWGGTLEQPTLAGHLEPWTTGFATKSRTNLLVHAARSWAEAEPFLRQGLAGRDDAPLVVLVILPQDRLLEAGTLDLGAESALVLTDDPGARWTKLLGIEEIPSTLLLCGEPTPAWSRAGTTEPRELAASLHDHAARGGKLAWRHTQLGLPTDTPAPDFPLQIEPGVEISLRKLGRRSITLSFLAAWSPPSITHLQRLAHGQTANGGDYVVAVIDGEQEEETQKLAERESLPFPIVADHGRRIATAYGIACWPTTVRIDRDLRVEGATFGLPDDMETSLNERRKQAERSSAG